MHITFRVRFPNHDQLRGISVRERADKQIVRNRKNGQTRSQAQSQRQNRSKRKPRAPAEAVPGVSDVLPARVEPHECGPVAHRFLHRFQADEFHKRLSPSLFRAHTAAQVVVGVEPQMRLELSGPLPLALRFAEPAGQPNQHSAQSHDDCSPGRRKREMMAVVSSHCRVSFFSWLRPARVRR